MSVRKEMMPMLYCRLRQLVLVICVAGLLSSCVNHSQQISVKNNPQYDSGKVLGRSDEKRRALRTEGSAGAEESTMTSSAVETVEQSVRGTESGQTPALKTFTLEQAINRALSANRGLAGARDSTEAARLSIVGAESEFELKFFPGLEAGISGDSVHSRENVGAGIRLEKKLTSGTRMSVGPNLQRSDDEFRSGMDVSVTQPLLRGFSREFNLSGVRGAQFGSRTAKRSLYLTQVNTILATVGAVYEVVKQRELVELNEKSAERLRGHTEAARAKEKIGLATPIDTYRAEIQLRQAEDNLATVRESYRDALDNLKVLLALPLSKEIAVEAPLSYDAVKISEEESVGVALKKRVELDQAEDAVLESHRLARIAKHNTLPELNVALSYSQFGSDERFGRSFSLNDNSWGISLVSSTDLAQTAAHASYDQSMLSVRAVARNQESLKDNIIRQTRRELRNLRKLEKRIGIQQEQIEQARGKLELAKVKFQRGLANNFDMIEAEAQLRNAQIQLLSLVIDHVVATYRLRGVMGTLVDRPEVF